MKFAKSILFAALMFCAPAALAQTFDPASPPPIGSTTPNTGTFTTLQGNLFMSQTIVAEKTVAGNASVDLFAAGSTNDVLAGMMWVYTNDGTYSQSQLYIISIIGGGTPREIDPVVVSNRSYGSPFSITETQNSPISNENKLTFNNLNSNSVTMKMRFIPISIPGTLIIY